MQASHPAILYQNDISHLFEHIHSQRDRVDYQEIKQHAPAKEILCKWPLLAEMHAFNPWALEVKDKR